MGGCCIADNPVADFFKETIRDFKNTVLCSDSCCVGNAPEPSGSELHARKVADELAMMKEKSRESSQRLERELMSYINTSMDAFLAEIDKLNHQSFFGEQLNISTKVIREKNKSLNRQLVGCVSKVVNTRLVQTDRELSTILAEKNDKKRKANFDAFVDRVQKQALSQLRTEIEKTVQAQSEVVSGEIKARQKEVEARMEESVRELTEIVELKEKRSAALGQKQIGYMYQMCLCECLKKETRG